MANPKLRPLPKLRTVRMTITSSVRQVQQNRSWGPVEPSPRSRRRSLALSAALASYGGEEAITSALIRTQCD